MEQPSATKARCAERRKLLRKKRLGFFAESVHLGSEQYSMVCAGIPELAVLGDNKNPTKADKLELRDLVTGRIVKNISLGSSGIARQQASIRDVNGNGAREAAILQVGHNGTVNVLLRDSKSAGNLGAIGFDQNFPPKQLLTLSDINGNRSDEIVVFGVRKDLSS